MLARQHRLAKERDIKRVASLGRSFFTPALRLRLLLNRLALTRVAVVVPGQVSKQAVKRNRLRRQTQGALRAYLPVIRPGYDVVLHVRSVALKYDYQQLQRELLALLRKARLWQG